MNSFYSEQFWLCCFALLWVSRQKGFVFLFQEWFVSKRRMVRFWRTASWRTASWRTAQEEELLVSRTALLLKNRSKNTSFLKDTNTCSLSGSWNKQFFFLSGSPSSSFLLEENNTWFFFWLKKTTEQHQFFLLKQNLVFLNKEEEHLVFLNKTSSSLLEQQNKKALLETSIVFLLWNKTLLVVSCQFCALLVLFCSVLFSSLNSTSSLLKNLQRRYDYTVKYKRGVPEIFTYSIRGVW